MNESRLYLGRVIAFAMLTAAGPLISHASAQGAAGSAATLTLKTVTTDDKTASVGVPDGWTFAKGANGYVYVTGPNKETINLGAIVVAKNAPAGPGDAAQDVAFALPFTATLKEKFTTIIQTGAPKSGLPKPTISFASQTATKLPMCARLVGTSMYGSDSRTFEGVICSLQPDWLGLYKNIVFLLEAPSSHAADARPILEKIAASYRVTPAMFQKMVATYTPLPPSPPPALLNSLAPYQNSAKSAECFDYNIIRESPPWEVPMSCGGTNPYK
jgi:hypothetical protein